MANNAVTIATVAEALLPGGVAGCSADNCKDLGNSMLSKGKVADAVWLYSLGLAKREGCQILHSNRSAAHAKLMQWDDALRDADACIRVKPDWARGYGRRAAALEGKGRNADALVCLEKVLELDPGTASAQAGIETLQKKLLADPQEPSWTALGEFGGGGEGGGSGERGEDKVEEEPAEPVDPEVARAEKIEKFKMKGNKAFASGNFEDAIDYFTTAIELDKSNHVLYSNRSGAFSSVNQFQSALNDAQKCVNLAPTWPKGYGRKAAALVGLNKRAQAVDSYAQGLKIEPENALLLKGLAEISPSHPLLKAGGHVADAAEPGGDAEMGDGEKKEEGAGETTDEAPKEAKKVIQKVQLPEATEEEMDLLTSFMSETSSLERKIQVERIIKHKLNPFEVLKIKPVNTDEELNMSYRKVSLMVHPDKCTHPMAEEAFEVCKKSLAELQDAEKRGFYVECWDASRLEAERELKKLRKQEKDDAAKNKRATVEDVASLRNAFLGGSVRQRKRGRDDKKKDNDDEKEKDKNSIKAADDNEFSKEDEDKIAEFQREAAYRILQQLEKRRSKAEKVFIANEKRSVEARAKLGEKEKFEEKQDEGWGKDRLDRIDSWRDFQNHGTRMGIRKPKPNVTEKGVSVLPPTMGGFKKSAEEEELDSFLESTTGAGAE